MNRHTGFAFVLAAAVFAAGCDVNVDQDTDPAVQPGLEQQDPNQTGTQPMPPPDPAGEMRIEVNLQARELYVYRNNQRTATHSVAVGSSEWPTRTGEWTIDEVVLNPRWVPPEEEWAEDEEPAEPGDDDNPLGAAQLIYDAPRSIHGTNEPGSIGQAVSHGSIRVTNEVALELAREAMRAGGAD
ncbi:MAG TPA: L,D-transpeptidase, partial [Longimicrobiales bacterium]|nr:L,D-transpeptidase [Longimicrobiales bacterium]